MRSLHKEWTNGPGGKWTARIRWYKDEQSIRLQMWTPEGIHNQIFKRPTEESMARSTWDSFRKLWEKRQ